jgi:transposase
MHVRLQVIDWGYGTPIRPSAISDDEWAFVAPYLTLMTEEVPQRLQRLREVLNGLRWLVRAGLGA